MCRLVGWVSDVPVTPRQVLGPTAVQRLLHLADVHCHGWGAAWLDGRGRLEVRRSAVAASADPDFASVLDGAATTAGLLHLRMGTPGYGRRVAETHPFTDGVLAFAHNGAVLPSEGVGALLSPTSVRRALGTTDSERIFLALLDEFGGEPPDAQRVADAIAVVVERARRSGLHASSWNSLLLGAEGLFVVSNHDKSWVAPDIKLWPDVYPPQATWPPYFDLRLRATDGVRVVLSSGIVDDIDGWELLPNATVVHLRGGSTEAAAANSAGSRSRIGGQQITDAPVSASP